ncbi:hypothetical protein ACU6TU_08420 [Halomonas sp. LS-001]
MTRNIFVPLGGGLDLVTPLRQMSPGKTIACVNYECPVTGGYARIEGYTQMGPEVPGVGPILGVATFYDRHYAIRKNGESIITEPEVIGTVSSDLIIYDPSADLVTGFDAGWFSTGSRFDTLAGSKGNTRTTKPFPVKSNGEYLKLTWQGVIDRTRIRWRDAEGNVESDYEPWPLVSLLSVGEGATEARVHFSSEENTLAHDPYIAMYDTDFLASPAYTLDLLFRADFGNIDLQVGWWLDVESDELTRRFEIQEIKDDGWLRLSLPGGAPLDDVMVNRFMATITVTRPPENVGANNKASLYQLVDIDADNQEWVLIAGGLEPSRHSLVEGNLYATDAGNALYGVAGGKPFELAQDNTLTVIADAQPGATSIAVHQNHLFLGYPAGSVQFSGIGDPLNWNAATGGAGEIGVGQTVTGIVPGVGGVLHILTRDSIQMLRGTSEMDWQLVMTAPNTGAREHSAQTMLQPYFVSERGITALQAAQEFGDFSALHPGAPVEPLFTKGGLPDRVVASGVSKRKAQYRVWFDNGTGFYMSPTGITQVQYPVQVAAAHSAELFSGEEFLMMGDDEGRVYRLDHGDDFNGEAIRAFLTLNYNDINQSSMRKRFRRAFFDIRSGTSSRIWVQPSFEYGDCRVALPCRFPIDFILSGGLWNIDSWNEFYWSVGVMGIEMIDLPGTATSVNFAIFSDTHDAPHELLGYDLHFQPRRLKRG